MADELADMLGRLEAKHQKEETVDAAVKNKVEDALVSMMDEIEKLVEVSEYPYSRTVPSSLEQKEEKRIELNSKGAQMEFVPQQIEDIETMDEMAELIDVLSDNRGNGRAK